MDKFKLPSRLIKFEERLPLERFLTLVSIITILILIAVGIFTYNMVKESHYDSETVSLTHKKIVDLNNIVITARDAVSRVASVIHGIDKPLLNVNAYQIKTNGLLAEIKYLDPQNVEQLKKLNIVDSLTVQSYLILNKSLEEFKKAPDNKTIQTEFSISGKKLSDSLRAVIKDITDVEEKHLEDRIVESESSNTYSKFFIIITSLIGFSVIVFSLHLTRQLIGLRNKAYSELQNSYDILEDKVEERTLDLKKSNEVLKEEISNRNKAESAVKEREERFRSLADAAPVFIWLDGVKKDRIYFNKSWFGLTGRTLRQEVGTGWQKGIHPEDLEKYFHVYENAFESRKSFEIEYRILSAAGDYRWLLSNGVPRFEGDVFSGYIGSSSDITHRKIIERHLKIQRDVSKVLASSETLEEGLRNVLYEVCSELRWDYGVVRHYHDAEKIIGIYSDGKVSDENTYGSGSFILKEITAGNKGIWKDNLNNDPEAKESFEVKTLGYKTILAFPVTEGKKIVALFECYNKNSLHAKDDFIDALTSLGRQMAVFVERKRAEEELKQMNDMLSLKVNERTEELQQTLSKLNKEVLVRKENEDKLNVAQQIAHLGNWEWIINQDVINWSDELYNIFGLKKTNKAPNFEEYISYIHPEDVDLVKETVSQTLKTGKPFNYFHRIITPGGVTKTLNSQGQVAKDDSGNIIRMFGIAHDVTDLKRTEVELRETYNKLQETQRELVHKEKLSALGRFSSGIAHEIRNPLANISALAQILNKAPLDEKLKKHLKYILINTEIANKIIKDLLNFASPEELSLVPESINAVLEEIFESVENRCLEKNIKVVNNISKELPPIKLDKKKLNLAFMNFVSNGIDAMSAGGTLTLDAGTDRQTNEVVIKFQDTGIGIPKDNFDKILEPFYTTKDEGTGLGMGLAYQVIKSHYGTLTIESEEGLGTLIEVRLPITNNQN